jgi:hypothetical protein
LLIAGLGKLLMGDAMTQFMMLMYLIVISVLTLGITAIATTAKRSWVFDRLRKNKI